MSPLVRGSHALCWFIALKLANAHRSHVSLVPLHVLNCIISIVGNSFEGLVADSSSGCYSSLNKAFLMSSRTKKRSPVVCSCRLLSKVETLFWVLLELGYGGSATKQCAIL